MIRSSRSRDGGTGGTPCIVSPRQKGVTDSRASRSGGGGKHRSSRAAGGFEMCIRDRNCTDVTDVEDSCEHWEKRTDENGIEDYEVN